MMAFQLPVLLFPCLHYPDLELTPGTKWSQVCRMPSRRDECQLPSSGQDQQQQQRRWKAPHQHLLIKNPDKWCILPLHS